MNANHEAISFGYLAMTAWGTISTARRTRLVSGGEANHQEAKPPSRPRTLQHPAILDKADQNTPVQVLGQYRVNIGAIHHPYLHWGGGATGPPGDGCHRDVGEACGSTGTNPETTPDAPTWSPSFAPGGPPNFGAKISALSWAPSRRHEPIPRSDKPTVDGARMTMCPRDGLLRQRRPDCPAGRCYAGRTGDGDGERLDPTRHIRGDMPPS